MQRRLERARTPRNRSAIERQIGRLLGRNSRAAGRYRIELLADPAMAAQLRLRWAVRADWDERARQREGCYLLRTNVRDWTPETMWQTYTQLWEVEAAFRIHKSELAIRPIWHQKEARVQAHILVCFLAYVLWKTLEQWQARAGLGNSRSARPHQAGVDTSQVMPGAHRDAILVRVAPALRSELEVVIGQVASGPTRQPG